MDFVIRGAELRFVISHLLRFLEDSCIKPTNNRM
jgi:hypothetical protein